MNSFFLALALYLLNPTQKTPAQGADSAQNYTLEPPALAPFAPQQKDPAQLGIDTDAKSAVVMDWDSGAVLFEKDAQSASSIASITKLMTSLVALGEESDINAKVAIGADDLRSGNVHYITPGDSVTVNDLLHLTLVASSNDAAAALARSTGLAPADFVSRMNDTAASFGMTGTTFTDPTGLDPGNMATAQDVAVLLKHALDEPRIRQAVTQRDYQFTTDAGKQRTVRSTDMLLGNIVDKPSYQLLGGKTGFINEAGYCFGAAAADEQGHRVIAVVLGTKSKEDRFSQVKHLFHWTFDAYRWPEKVSYDR